MKTILFEMLPKIGKQENSIKARRADPIRILFYVKAFNQGGIETALLNWLNALDRRHFSPCLCIKFQTDDFTQWGRAQVPKDVPIRILASQAWSRSHERQRTYKGWQKTMRRVGQKILGFYRNPIFYLRFKNLTKKCEVVVDFDMSLAKFAGNFNVPWIGVRHFGFSRFGEDKSEAFRRKDRRRMRRYSAIGLLVPEMMREAQNFFNNTGINFVELHNVIDKKKLQRLSMEPAQIGATDYFVSVARLESPQKDHETLLNAYAKFLQISAIKPKLLLLGDGSNRANLERLVERLSITPFVEFSGFVPNPFPYIARARALVLSSRSEGAPMVIGEAMALGTPVIATDCPTGPRDLLEDGAAGYLIPVADAQALCECLCRVLDGAENHQALMRRASKRVQQFSPEASSLRLRKVIDDLLSSAN